jgi:5-methylcytosine-specific restriction endonuclease McrA
VNYCVQGPAWPPGACARVAALPSSPSTFRPHGGSATADRRDYDRARGSATARLYDWRWTKASKAHLRADPLCHYCALERRASIATLVDHLYPHQGDVALFWRRDLWVSSCKPCHDGFKQAIERQGRGAIDELARRLGISPAVDPPGGSKV